MHRHGYTGRKFGRERDQRRALIKSLAESLIVNESIETTLPKAKEIRPYVEKLITRAKKGDLASRRMVISGVMTVETAHKLVDEIAPKLGGRNSGYLRIVRTKMRRGDNAQLARVSFVDDLSKPGPKVNVDSASKSTTVTLKKPAAKAKTPAKKTVAKKPAVKKVAPKKTAAKKKEAKK
jgi:large subunit ribosomal protein L17